MREAVAAVPREGAVAVALSGGVDSTVLLHAVATGPAPPRTLRALHVNHGLQAQAGAWERHCRAFATDLGVPLGILRGPAPRGNLEAGARRVRYAAWARALAADEVLLLAHHADDQAETVVWQLATGRAPVGMPRERPLGSGRLLRPLLGVRRETIAEYAGQHGLAWVEDRTNADTAFDRNYIRHEILPGLEARFPGAVTAIAATAGAWSVVAPAHPLAVAGLDRPTLRQWLGAAASERCIDEILRQAGARPGASPVVTLPDGRSVRRHKGCLHVVAPEAAVAPPDGTVVVQAGCAAALPHGTIRVAARAARTVRPGALHRGLPLWWRAPAPRRQGRKQGTQGALPGSGDSPLAAHRLAAAPWRGGHHRGPRHRVGGRTGRGRRVVARLEASRRGAWRVGGPSWSPVPYDAYPGARRIRPLMFELPEAIC